MHVSHSCFRRQTGNVMFMLLIAILLFAALTAAITRSDQGSASLTGEKTNLSADRVASFGVDVKRATENIVRNGNSEAAIRFSHADLTGYGTPDTTPKTEVFNIQGGGAGFMTVPENMNDGSQWEFTGATAAPGVGDNATADLIMVLPNVNERFCRAFNKKAGYGPGDAIPTDGGACVYDTGQRFNGAFSSSPNVMDAGTFRATPAPYACVACGSAYHVYYVLMER